MRLTFVLIIIPFIIYCQEYEKKAGDFNHEIILESKFLYENNILNLASIYNLLDGNKLTNLERDNIVDLANGSNLFFDLTNYISYKNNRYNFNIIFSDNNFLNCNLPNDFMKLLFEGNANPENQNLNISNSNIRIQRYQQYKISYSFKEKNYILTSGISYLSGNYHAALIIENGNINTAPLGQQIELNYNFLANISDTNKINTLKNHGHGIALDINFNFIIEDYNIDLYLRDFGFINWKKGDLYYKEDSTIFLNGLNIDNIFEWNDSIVRYDINDYTQNISQKYKSYIPAKFGVSIQQNLDNNYFQIIKYGVDLRWQPYQDNQALSFSKLEQGINESNYSPLYWLSASKNGKYISFHPNISYGGYNTDVNIGISLSIGNKNKLILGTQHLDDIIDYNNSNEISFFIIFSKKI